MRCVQCESAKFRLSKMRRPDLARILSLHYPVCCRVCQQRQYLPLSDDSFRTFIDAFRRRMASRAKQRQHGLSQSAPDQATNSSSRPPS